MNAIEIARRILDLYWDYKIPVNIDMIAEKMGANVRYLSHLDFEESGNDISGRFDIMNGQAVCSIRNTDSPQRQRFTLAHELGHFALGHGGGFRDNSASFNLNNYDQREIDANAFAAEVLMPKRAIDYVIQEKNITDFMQLASLFNVSVPAMKYRLRNLGWIGNY